LSINIHPLLGSAGDEPRFSASDELDEAAFLSVPKIPTKRLWVILA